ncbi:MAG TPA: histidine kinase dimerization/phospho-acceptor domain-containing protein, partial [Pseudomonadales bacterium]|nr:histidine kinase dimerization/phospho-acceptor domain-containing protein [Pseudomonadales bacterium]
SSHPVLLYFACFSYAALNILTLTLLRVRGVPTHVLTFLAVMIDILAITAISYARNESGSFDILLGVSVAAGNILLVGEVGYALAAMATLASGFEQIYSTLMDNTEISADTYWRVAIFGVALFGTSLISQQLSKRMRASEALADQRAADLAELEKLNEHIIQRMRTGILVVNKANQLLLMNESAWRMLGNPIRDRFTELNFMCPVLAEQLNIWRQNPELRGKPFKATPHCPEVTASFSALYGNTQTQVLIFLDDNSRLTQHAQQLKLASLGRLTAGIAHEIRNPLGAISHAAQLLGESNELTPADIRLAEIIQNHSVRMNKVIENVLQLSRRKQPNPELIDLKEWLENFRTDFNLADSGNNEISIEINPEH